MAAGEASGVGVAAAVGVGSGVGAAVAVGESLDVAVAAGDGVASRGMMAHGTAGVAAAVGARRGVNAACRAGGSARGSGAGRVISPQLHSSRTPIAAIEPDHRRRACQRRIVRMQRSGANPTGSK